MKTFSILALLSLVLTGCFSAYTPISPAPAAALAPAPVRVSSPAIPEAMTVSASSPAKTGATATLAWSTVNWGTPVYYRVGWNTVSNQYNRTATTVSTNYQATGLGYATTYFFAVQSVDVNGIASPWSPGWRYTTPAKKGSLASNPPVP